MVLDFVEEVETFIFLGSLWKAVLGILLIKNLIKFTEIE